LSGPAKTYETILVEDDGPVRTITLNRPDRRNAMTPEMQDELIDAMECSASEACRIVVFRGAGEAFCAGLDLSALRAMRKDSMGKHEADAARLERLFRTLYELQKPTIAAVHGPAIAGGAGLATICDFTVATPLAKFGYTEVRIGFVPAIVSAFLTLQLGEKGRRDVLLSGRVFDSKEAYRLGLVNEVVAAEDLDSSVQGLTKRLLANSPEALAATKRLLVEQNRVWLDAALRDSLEASIEARTTADFEEGIAAFLDKRTPKWAP
jgi:methylglutaconyl-CoA hydratase